MILGGGPNRIGQGIEFDYCCVHAAFALKEDGFETIMVNSNPETVSTDYDTSDKLFFEPLTLEDVLHIYEREQCWGAIAQFGGQTPLNLALGLQKNGVNIIGTSPQSIEIAEDRKLFAAMLDKLEIPQPPNGLATNAEEALAASKKLGYPVLVRPSFVLGGRAMQIVYSDAELQHYMRFAVEASPERPVLVDKFLEDATEVDVDCIADIGQFNDPDEGHDCHRRHSGAHRICRRPFRRRRDGAAAAHALQKGHRDHPRIHPRDGARVEGRRPDERPIRREGRKGLRARSQSARVAHRAVRQQGHRRSAGQARRQNHGRKNLEGTRLHEGNLAEVLGGEGIRFPVQPLSRAGHFALAGNALHRRGHGAGRGSGHRLREIADGRELVVAAGGKVFISVSDAHKKQIASIARQFAGLGFELTATGGTAAVLEKAGLKVQRVMKLLEGRPNVIDLMKNKEIQLVINTPSGAVPREDEIKIRTTAIYTGTPIITTLSGAKAAALGIAALKKSGYGVKTLQEYH